MKTLVLGLGNPLVTDDSVGLRVTAELKKELAGRTDVEVNEDYWGGLRLMERMAGFDRAIVIDAIQTGAAPGTIHHLLPASIPTQQSASAHDVNLPTALARGVKRSFTCPKMRTFCLSGSRPKISLPSARTVPPPFKRPSLGGAAGVGTAGPWCLNGSL